MKRVWPDGWCDIPSLWSVLDAGHNSLEARVGACHITFCNSAWCHSIPAGKTGLQKVEFTLFPICSSFYSISISLSLSFSFPFSLFPFLSLSLSLSVTSATILKKSLLWPCLVGGLRQCRRSRDGLFDHQAPWRSPSCPGCGCRKGERQAAKSEGEMYRQGLQVQSRVALWHFETDTRLCECHVFMSSQDNIDKVMLNLSEEFVGLK